MIKFKTQFDKLVKAYLQHEIEPMAPCACFVGNLLNRNSQWTAGRHASGRWGKLDDDMMEYLTAFYCINKESEGTYTVQEIFDLEKTFMTALGYKSSNCEAHDFEDEDLLFEAFEKTLLHLREIHESKGEVIDNYIFTKREVPVFTVVD